MHHYGKTPPCADAIVRCGIPRVVIGLVDLSKKVKSGVERMRAAGVEVCYESLDGWLLINTEDLIVLKPKKTLCCFKMGESKDGFLLL